MNRIFFLTCTILLSFGVNSQCTSIPSCMNITANLDANGNVDVSPSDIDNGSTDNCGGPVVLSFMQTANIGTNVTYVNYSELWQPFASDFSQARYQVLYTATELSAQGLTPGSLITSISFNIADKNTTTPISNFEVSVAQVPVTTIGNASNDFYITPMTVVRPAAPYTTVLGWNEIPFSSVVTWDGVSSLLVQTCHSGGSNGGDNPDGVYTYDVTGGTRVVSGYFQSCTDLQGLYSHSKLPELKINYLETSCATIGTNVTYVDYSESWQPFASDFSQARYQVLYTATELSAQGLTPGSLITSISFNIADKNTTTPISNFEVSVAQVPVTTIGNASNDFYITPMTVVRPAAPYTTVLGWNEIPFSSVVTWDGVSSLLVQTCHSGGSNGGDNPDGVYTYDVTGGTRVVSGYFQSCTDLQGLYSHSKLPELKICTLGSGPITYSCSDIGANNVELAVISSTLEIGTCKAVITITDVIDPVMPTLSNITDECSASATAPTTTDNCAGIISATTTDPLTYTSQGTHTINWTFDDGNGNSIVVPQTVVIDDLTAPVADVAVLAGVTGCFEVTMTPPTATDLCVGAITGVPDVAFPITTPGTTVVTWTYDDGNGNTSTQTQNVIINTVDVGVTQTGTSLTANAVGTTYQWLDCDNGYVIIAGETNVSFSPTAVTGNYAVKVTENGCVDTSACTLIDFTGIENLEHFGISISPNPSTGKFSIDSESYKIESVQVLDVRGRLVYEVAKIDEANIKLDISDENPGVYFVKLAGEFGTTIKRIILQQ